MAMAGLSAFVGAVNSNDSNRRTLTLSLADPQGLDSYSYVENNPIKKADPDGKWAVDAGIAGVTVFGVSYLTNYAQDVGSNYQTKTGIYGILPTPAQVNHNLSISAERGTIVAGALAVASPLGVVGKAVAAGITTASVLSGYDVVNGYVGNHFRMPGQISWYNNAQEGLLSTVDEFIPKPANIYLTSGRPSYLNKSAQESLRSTVSAFVSNTVKRFTSPNKRGQR